MKLQPLAKNVWLFPHDPDGAKVQPSVGVICDARQTILIDGGNSDQHALAIQTALKEINAPPVQQIIYTHHHWDHVFGAHSFGVPTLGHRLCQQILNEEASHTWHSTLPTDSCYAASYPSIQRATIAWGAFRIVVPSQAFDDHLTLPLEGMTLELRHVGGQHAPDSIVIGVNGVLFMGDCFYPPRGTTHTDWRMLRHLLSDSSVKVFVSSHADPLRRREWLKFWGTSLWAALQARKA